MENKNQIVIEKPDSLLFVIVIFLLGIGIIMVYSATISNDPDGLYMKQVYSLIIAVACLIGFSFVNHNIYFKYSLYLLLISILLLILTLIPPFGKTINNASRWLNFGFVQFQSSEVAKLGLIIYLSATISAKGEKIKSFITGFLPLLLVTILVFFLIIIEPDFSMASLLLLTAIAMFYVGGIRFIYILLSFLFSVPILLSLTLFTNHRLDRIRAFFDPYSFSESVGYQTIRFIKALANGGMFGRGFGNGIQKHYIPYAFNDSIFSVIAEETGFIGSLIIILFYVLFAYRGYLIAFNAPTKASRLLAFGITTIIVFQTLINLSVVIGWIPITGMTLPFISYGGTSLVITCICAGILLNISKYRLVKSDSDHENNIIIK